MQCGHVQKLIKIPFIIDWYVDFETILKTISIRNDNPEEAYTTEINKRATSSFSIFFNYSYDNSKNKQYFYQG